MTYLTAPIAARRGHAPALIDAHGTRSWQQLDRRANRLIHALRAAGLAAGERIALYAGNGIAVYELMVAAHHMGLTYVPVNWHFTADELAHVLRDSEAVALLTDSRFVGTAAAALQRAPGAATRLRLCADAGSGAGRGGGAAHGLPPGFVHYEEFIAEAASAAEPEGQAIGGPMFYTSGTTGRPKGVLKVSEGPPPALQSLEASVRAPMAMLQLPAEGVTLLAGPYYHSAQWSFSFYPLLAGSHLVMTERFDAERTLALIDEHRVTNVHLVPTQFIRLLRLPEEQKRGFSGASLARVWHGAAPCPPEAKHAMIDWWGPCIHEYYGSTEGAVVTGISSAEWLQRPGSVGRTINLSDIHILRDDGSEAAVAEHGTIYLRHRRGLELRYHNDPQKTAAAHAAAGLFTTGDIGWLDAEGYLYLTDRKIDMIISGGVNIYPAEIEAVLAGHPAVQDVAVIGVPNAEFGEEVKAIVQPTAGWSGPPGSAPAAGEAALVQALAALCREKLAGYKVPRSFELRSELPRTETGKLQKRLLREAYWAGSGRHI